MYWQVGGGGTVHRVPLTGAVAYDGAPEITVDVITGGTTHAVIELEIPLIVGDRLTNLRFFSERESTEFAMTATLSRRSYTTSGIDTIDSTSDSTSASGVKSWSLSPTGGPIAENEAWVLRVEFGQDSETIWHVVATHDRYS
jgi:hypothetical protein